MIRLDTIGARIALAMLGLVVLLALSVGVLHFAEGGEHDEPGVRLSARIGDLAEMLDATPRQDRAGLIAAVRGLALKLDLGDAPLPYAAFDSSPKAWWLRKRIESFLAAPQRKVLVGGAGPAQGAPLLIQVPLADGQWLHCTVADPAAFGRFPLSQFVERNCILAFFVWLLSLWTARWLAAPIAEFAGAAEKFGKDLHAAPLAERGPRELRTAIRAFNRMQERLQRFVRDRTQMVAAMSHDLRTPLTRLSLRTEFIDDPEKQRKMRADLDEMIRMIESTLSFARDDFSREPRIRVDLCALAEGVCEDAADAGADVRCSATERIELECRPDALRRALVNLVDNAVKYGGCARLAVLREAHWVVITVDDDGPGIPEDQQEKVFAPFYRLEASRNRDTGGVGLGLALVRTIVRGHGGDVGLSNRAAGGLRVRLDLPV
jgi:signal transduction histidine kinase